MKTKQSNKNDQGMVLIVALIMLAMVTFMVVAFLAYARVDRSSVAMSMRETNTRFLHEVTQTRVQAIMNSAIGSMSGAGVSENVDGNGTTREYTLGELTGLQTKARPPVYVDLDEDGVYDEFQYFLNLNKDTNAAGRVNYQPTTPEKIGDPHWIGVLEDPDSPHGPDNRFVARYAYLVVPTDQQLDINRVHNKDKSIPGEDGTYPEGYQRLQGNACWEMNLAGALAMIDPQEFVYKGYIQQGDKSSFGTAFRYAGGPHLMREKPFAFTYPVYAGLWNYRYQKNYFTQDRTNQREFIDLLDFLKEPGLRDVFGEVDFPNNPSDYQYLHNYFKTPGQGGRAFYDMLGSITTHAAVAPTTHLSPQTMKPILGMPPTEKLLINQFFTDDDFYHRDNGPNGFGRIDLNATKFEVNEAVGTAVAEVILFDENHGLTTGQNVFFSGGSTGVGSTLHHPDSFNSVPSRELYVQVLDSKRVTLWDVPVRPGNPMAEPPPIHKVRFQAYQRNGDQVVPVRDLSAFPEEFALNLSYDPLAKKFTQLASLMLQNAMVRTSLGVGEKFHIGSDTNLVLFYNVQAVEDREKEARYFGANNIQIYPPSKNNFTPEVQRLLQVALNLAEVYSPDYAYDITGDGVKDLKLAWPLVFRPIISHEPGGNVYIAGWRRVGLGWSTNWTNSEWWTNSYDLPASVSAALPGQRINPFGWLGDLPDRPVIAPAPTPPVPVYGSGTNRFPLLIGVNKRTQVDSQLKEGKRVGKIWPSVNELSASVTMNVDHLAPGTSTAELRVRVELRDNLRAVFNNDGALLFPLRLRLLVKGTISGTLNGAAFNQALYCNEYLSVDPSKDGWPVFDMIENIPLTPNSVRGLIPGIPTDPSKRVSWKVDNLRLKADVVILCADPNEAAIQHADGVRRLERIVDISRVNFFADLPPQYKTWEPNKKYKKGEQIEIKINGQLWRCYARRDHESSLFFDETFQDRCWKPAIWGRDETFYFNDIIRCRELVVGVGFRDRLFRCLRQHTTTRDPNENFDPLAVRNGKLLWARYWGETYEMSWQVNDPLVNGMSRDYTLVHPLVKNNGYPNVEFEDGTIIPPPPYTLYDNMKSNNLKVENYVYRPWSLDKSSYSTPDYPSPWADSFDHICFKDPGIYNEGSWWFPHKDTGGIETLGWLGLVHRGTPWQTIYLKSKPANQLLVQSIDPVTGVINASTVPFFWQGDRVKLQGGSPDSDYQGFDGNIRYYYGPGSAPPRSLRLWDASFTVNKLSETVGYTHNPAEPSTWLYLMSTDAWQRQTGTLDTLPTNDHRLVDIFSTPPSGTSEGAQTSLLSVNAKSPTAWAAVLSGVAVPTSKKKGITLHYFHRKHPGNCTETDCATFDYRLYPNQSMRNLVKSINEHRVLHGGDQEDKIFERVSDILSVPELTISQPAYQAMIVNGDPDDWRRTYPDELDYERIPQQILSLLRTDSTPRFVAYVFSQTLKPAKGSLDEDGLCRNYTIDRESARRTVFRIEGMEKWREYNYLKKCGLTPARPAPTRVVKESTVPLRLR